MVRVVFYLFIFFHSRALQLAAVSSVVVTTEPQLRKPLKQPQKQDTACDVTIQ